jgi:protein SCO1
VKPWISIALGTVLLAAFGAAVFIAAAYRPAARSAELENFHLAGPAGHSYSIESFPTGSVLAIYFGYTTCLRACPTALNDLAEAIDRMGNLGASVQPVFIDMDPDRAALVGLPAYMEAFGPSFLGLTGPSDDIERAAKSFKVKVERSQLSADPTDYVMKHASPIFVMRPSDPHPKPLPASSSPAIIEAALRSAL